MRIEILHMRDPDASCEHAIFVNGVPVKDADLVLWDQDPGAGYCEGDIEEDLESVKAQVNWSAAFKAAVLDSYEQMMPRFRKFGFWD